MEENPDGNRSVRGRPIKDIDYRKMAGLGSGSDDDHEILLGNKPMKKKAGGGSTKSKKSVNSARLGKNVMPQKQKSEESEDSREGDFDTDNGSQEHEDRLKEMEKEISELQPSVGEKYNQYKCDIGEQDRLEDCELPEELDKDEVYNNWVALHEKQEVATIERERGADRCLELMKVHNKIIEVRNMQSRRNGKQN